ncbi:hypothetical protein L1887_48476 [Cichorium endivia]|nr:hypothetical protein L1887_48476 [Cichorium endivia]
METMPPCEERGRPGSEAVGSRSGHAASATAAEAAEALQTAEVREARVGDREAEEEERKIAPKWGPCRLCAASQRVDF